MRQNLETLFAQEGLVLLGIVPLQYAKDYERFSKWLAENRHAGMQYLEKYQQCRKDPALLLPGAKHALVIGLPYFLGDEMESESTRVAQYARLVDYHRVLRRKAERLFGRFLRERVAGEGVTFRVTVDTAPLLERALAAKTQDGFIGKNTCYIHPERGSFLLLAEILTTLELPLDEKIPVNPAIKTKTGGCGNCERCQVHCPTGALDETYTIDANRCLSYWTIEHRGTIPEEFWPWLGKYYFGCDICQLVCPYNWKAKGNTPPAELKIRELPPLFEIATMNQQAYEKYFGGTAMTRAKRGGLRRNALIAMTVTRDPRLAEAIELARGDCESPVGETVLQIEKYLAC